MTCPLQDENHGETPADRVRDREPFPGGQTRAGRQAAGGVARVRGPSTVRAAQGVCDTVPEGVQTAVAPRTAAQTQGDRNGHAQDRMHPEKRSSDVGDTGLQEEIKRRPGYTKVPTNYITN